MSNRCPDPPEQEPEFDVDTEYAAIFGDDPEVEFDDSDDPPEMYYDERGDVVYCCHECGRDLYDGEVVICSDCIESTPGPPQGPIRPMRDEFDEEGSDD